MSIFTETLSVKYLLLIYIILALPWVFATQARIRRLFGARLSLVLNILRSLVMLFVLLSFVGLTVMLPLQGEPGKVVILEDRSMSMQMPESSDDQAARAVKAELAAGELESILSGDWEVERYWFGRSMVSAGDSASLRSIEGNTDMMTVLDEVLARSGDGDRIVLITDGRVTLGRNAPDAEALRGSPVYGLIVGDPLDIFDASVAEVTVDEPLYQGEETQVRILLTGFGTGAEDLDVSISLDEKIVETKKVKLGGRGTNVEIVTDLPAMQPGMHMLEVSIEVEGDQFTRMNDSRSLYLKVKRSRKPVVLYSTTPDWDYAYLTRHATSFEEYDARVFVGTGGGTVAGLEGPDHHVDQAAARCAGVLGSADLIVLHGDMAQLPQTVRRAAASKLDRGGVGLLLLPSVSWKRSGDWLELGPFCPFGRGAEKVSAEGGVTADPGSTGHAVISLGLGDEFSDWNELPPLGQVLTGVELATDFSEILTAPVTGGITAPVLVGADRGDVRVLVLLGNGFWQWDMFPLQFGKGPYYRELSRGMLEWLSEPSVFREVSCEPSDHSSRKGDGIVFTRSGGKDEKAATEVVVTAMGRGTDTESSDSLWQLTFGERGERRSPVIYLPPGLYQYRARELSEDDGVIAGEGSFYVDDSSDEFDDPRPDAQYLEELARQSGGRIYPAGQVLSLGEEIRRTVDRGRGKTRVDLRREPLMYAALLLVFFAELIIRRRKGLP